MISIADLEKVSIPEDTPAGRAVRLATLLYKTDYYDEFVSLIHEYLEEIFADFNEHRQHLQTDSEDRLNIDIVSRLKGAGFSATHDTQTGGHCDIYVTFKKAKWIGEAKKIASNQQSYIAQGLLQLTERYASGIKFQTEGAVIIYCFAPDAQKVLSDLCKKMNEDGYLVENKAHQDDLHFRTSKKHTGTGNQYYVTCYIIPLYHNPIK